MTFRFRRRPDDWASDHERARALSAAQLDEALDAGDQAWLDAHLASCGACASVANAYAAQRAELQSLRTDAPEPPRDLWARTAAAIEREAAATGVARRSRRHPAPIPLGAIAGVLVVAVVVGASLLSRPTAVRPGPLPSASPVASVTPVTSAVIPTIRPTPIDVTADNVGWVTLGADGSVDVYDATVDRVCPTRDDSDCPPIEQSTPKSIKLPDQPASVNRSPKDEGLIVVDSDTKSGGGSVYVLPAAVSTPLATPSPTSTATPGASASATPVVSASASAAPVTPEPGSPAPPTPTPSDVASPTPSAAASPTASVRVTATPGSGTIAIARDVIVVGESEAYSPDGAWFAFTARPADESHGPDIYLWRPGDAEAHAVTKDHRSVFAAWFDGRLLGSRVAAAPGKPDPAPTSFLIDPASGVETLLRTDGWRPSVDPAGRLAVYWDGSVAMNDKGSDLQLVDGRLVVAPWPGSSVSATPATPSAAPSATASAPTKPAPSESAAGPAAEPATPPIESPSAPDATATASPGDAAAASPSVAPSASPSATPLVTTQLAAGRVPDWDARWDESGTHLAIWIATDTASRVGDLTLYSVDAATGRLKPLHHVASLAGFSIGKGRLAWATPRGQDGQGSRLQVVAWTNDAVGSVESRQSSEVLVVIR